MANDQPNRNNLQIPKQHKVVIIGGGPVGLTASLLLSQYHIPHILVEQMAKPDNHPQAHFINCRSMEIFRELNGLDQVIYAHSAPRNEWRRFVYSTGLADLPALNHIKPTSAGALLGVVDHFADVQDERFSPGRVTHFPQHDFVRLLREAALQNPFCILMEGFRAKIRENRDRVTVMLSSCRGGAYHQIDTQFVVAADGAHSSTRKQLGIALEGQTGTVQHLINVHFMSPQLARHLQSRIPAMLYFVYNSSGVAVLVAHALKKGEFVAQIPYFPPLQRPEDFDQKKCIELLQALAGIKIPIDICSIRKWRMGIGLASRFQSEQGRCFLIGDAAHQFTPAGGFGMNTGIQDAHNLIWKLALVLGCENSAQIKPAHQLLSSYEHERKPIARENAKLSVENYHLTLRIPKAIGLNYGMIKRLLQFISCWPQLYPLKRRLFHLVLRLGLKQVEWLKFNFSLARRRRRAVHKIFSDAKRQTLQLLFPGQDLGFNYTTGWLFGADMNEMGAIDPFVHRPQLKIGGRMPHFWLVDKRDRRVSVLDLPSRMMGASALPAYVLLMAGELKTAVPEIDELTGQPIAKVFVSHIRPLHRNHFSYDRNRPSFLPKSYAILIRPDGHIAWLKTRAE